MKLYLDTIACQLTLAANSTQSSVSIPAKLGTTLELEIFPNNALDEIATGIITCKPSGNYSSAAVASALSWTPPASSGSGYIFQLNLNTSDLLALFSANPASVTLMADITWVNGGITNKTQTIAIVVANSVSNEDDGTPTDIPDLKATTGQAQAGTDDNHWMTPLKTAQAIAALGGDGGISDAPSNDHYYLRQNGQWVTLDPSSISVPTITGTEEVGQALTLGMGTWEGTVNTLAWSLFSNVGGTATGTPVASGTLTSESSTASYVLQSGDLGNKLVLQVTASNLLYSSAPADSASTAAVAAAPGLTGVIAAYTFNNTLADESGNGNDATNVNATPFVTDPAGSNMVAKFDGTGTSSITSPVVMGEGQAFTLRTPFYVVDNTRSAEYPALFNTDFVNSTNMLDYILGDNRSDRNWLNLNDGGGNLGQEQNITEGQWCDSVITYDPSVGLNWFLNGVHVLSNNTSFGDLSFNGILIGNTATPPQGQGHVYVRDWMILNRALNQAAATALFNSGSPLNVAAATTALATL